MTISWLKMAVTTARCRPRGPPQYVVIHNTVNCTKTEGDLEFELEHALDAKAEIIVIEPVNLGDETASWIKVGNILHKSGVILGIICSLFQCLDPKRKCVIVASGLISVVCAGVYTVSWQRDPCSKYQVQDNVPKLEELLTSLNSLSPVVLVRRDDCRRRKLHNIIASISGLICTYKYIKWLTST